MIKDIFYPHPGNQDFRKLVKKQQQIYLVASKRTDKPYIATHIVETIRSRGGRFLRRTKTGQYGARPYGWLEIDDKKAYEKACQALREGAPEIRRRLLLSKGSGLASEESMEERRCDYNTSSDSS